MAEIKVWGAWKIEMGKVTYPGCSGVSGKRIKAINGSEHSNEFTD